jgi:hypothetical protein
MDKREIFPTIMFVLAGAAFLFGGLQYFQASALQSAAQKRMAFIMTSIEKSPIGVSQKKQLYASIAEGLPSSPGLFSIDFSGSFASPVGEDACVNEGQRAICRALILEQSDASVITAVCGACSPR